MEKESLYGWSYMKRSAFAKFDLTIEPNEDKVAFGEAQHMDVCGWPESHTERMDIAQDLCQLEHRRCILESPLPVTLIST